MPSAPRPRAGRKRQQRPGRGSEQRQHHGIRRRGGGIPGNGLPQHRGQQRGGETIRRAQPSAATQRHRRTIYMLQIRSLQTPFVKVFDGPNIDESCAVREVTTVTPQVFALFNSKFVREQSLAMAKRIEREVGTRTEAQVERAFELAFQRSPSGSEQRKCASFLQPRVDDAYLTCERV